MKLRFAWARLALAAALAVATIVPSDALVRTSPPQATASAGGSCASGLVDSVPASPGAYTWGVSFRKLRAAYAGSAVQLQRTTSGNPTQDIGFSGCDLDAAAVSSFCGTASLAITSTTARVALPSGSSVFVYNSDFTGTNAYVTLGNSTVTATAGSGTKIAAQSGTWLTTSTNTHIAGIVASTTSGSSTGGNTLKITNCGVSAWYDQINTNNAVQATQANQFGFFIDADNGKPGGVCGSNLNSGTTRMTVPDSATYKTAVVHMFGTAVVGWSTHTNASNKTIINYPNDGSSDVYNVRWGLAFGPNGDQYNYGVNNNPFVGNTEGFGQANRTAAAVYDVSSANGVVRRNSGAFFTGGSTATVTYPTAVGMVVGGSSNGNGCENMVQKEILLANATQTTPSSAVTNTMTYWNITNPGTSKSTPDGFTYTANLWGSYAANQPPGPGNFTVNGQQYASEGTWAPWSIWQANNVKTSGTTSLGDMWRFEIRSTDEAWGNITGHRQELDGANGGAMMTQDVTYYIAYTFQLESGSSTVAHGTSFPGAQWNIPGQAHSEIYGAEEVASDFYFNVYDNQLQLIIDDRTKSAPTCVSNNNCQKVGWSSATNFVQPGTWIQVFMTVRKSSTGNSDIFTLNVGTAGGGATPQVFTCTGQCFFYDVGRLYWKFGIYRGPFEPLNDVPWTQAWRFGNNQVTTTDISAQITTPLDPPTHN